MGLAASFGKLLKDRAMLIASLSLDGNPTPASRPRVTRFGTFYGPTYKAWRAEAEKGIAVGTLFVPPTEQLLVTVESIVTRPKTTKKTWPKGDVDNYAKGPLDVVTKTTGWWTDDDQITWLIVHKRFANPGEVPHTNLEMFTI